MNFRSSYANDICSLPPGLRVGLFGSTQFHGAESQDFCQAGNNVLLGCLPSGELT